MNLTFILFNFPLLSLVVASNSVFLQVVQRSWLPRPWWVRSSWGWSRGSASCSTGWDRRASDQLIRWRRRRRRKIHRLWRRRRQNKLKNHEKISREEMDVSNVVSAKVEESFPNSDEYFHSLRIIIFRIFPFTCFEHLKLGKEWGNVKIKFCLG